MLGRLFSDPEETRKLTREFIGRVKAGVDSDWAARLGRLLDSHFPDDVGIFFALLMNLVTLNPGQGVFIDAGIPHSYLSGDCVEAQSCSDNVIRAGLTPKEKDPELLLDLLRFDKLGYPEILQASGDMNRYEVPCSDFALWRATGGCRLALPGPVLTLVVEGEGGLHSETQDIQIHRGESYLLTEPVDVLGNPLLFACCRGNI